ncbi:MAG: hypothetical protein J0L87_14740 [Bacteroidetes bacterium]|nr:hypothetical protein [Bacteroidota bacterium]
MSPIAKQIIAVKTNAIKTRKLIAIILVIVVVLNDKYNGIVQTGINEIIITSNVLTFRSEIGLCNQLKKSQTSAAIY